MLISVRHYLHKNILEQADEIRVPCNQMGDIYGFMKDHRDKRYIVEIPEDYYASFDLLLSQLNFLIEAEINFSCACENLHTAIDLIEKEIPAYFNKPIADYETYDFCFHKFTDVLIDGPLFFCMDKLHQAEGKYNRFNPVGSTVFEGPNRAFMRPEDKKYYEGFIQILEIKEKDATTEDKKITIESTVFDIYNRGFYNSTIGSLIKPVSKFKTNNGLVLRTFGLSRLNCEQKCLYRKCNICENALTLGDKYWRIMRDENN